MKKIFLTWLIVFSNAAFAQMKSNANFIYFAVPEKDSVISYSPTYRLSGSTLPNSEFFVNGKKIQLYPSGAFAGLLKLNKGENAFHFLSVSNGDSISSTVFITRKYFTKPTLPADSLTILSEFHLPNSDLMLNAGDVVKLRIFATPNCKAFFLNKFPLRELRSSASNEGTGIYVGRFKAEETDSLNYKRIFFTIINSKGDSLTKYFDHSFQSIPSRLPLTGLTKGDMPYLNYGLGTNRLGGAKMGFIQPGIALKITGAVGSQYRVELAKNLSAWIPKKFVEIDSNYSATTSLTSTIEAYGDSLFDFVALSLRRRLPYRAFYKFNPTRLIVDVFGATSNTNWLVQRPTIKEIQNITYRQAAENDFRMIIELKHRQPWGYLIYYSGNNLIVRIKHRPNSFDISDFTFALDAGHGGSNRGAVGSLGDLEKNINFSIVKHLQKLLLEEGARVILTRSKDTLIYNSKRLKKVINSRADFLISVHSNSIGLTTDPRITKGTTTFYKYKQNFHLAKFIFEQMRTTGLKPYGVVGKFNFTLNASTNVLNTLVETAYMSNPEDEMKLLDDDFRKLIARKILNGIKDFLEWAKNN